MEETRSFRPTKYCCYVAWSYIANGAVFCFKALQGDVTKLQRKLESLNETGAYMISKATPAFADKLKRELDELNGRWDELVRVALRVKDNLVASLEKYQKLSHDIKEMSHWIMKVERSIADDEGDTTSGEITQEKMDHYKVQNSVCSPPLLSVTLLNVMPYSKALILYFL